MQENHRGHRTWQQHSLWYQHGDAAHLANAPLHPQGKKHVGRSNDVNYPRKRQQHFEKAQPSKEAEVTTTSGPAVHLGTEIPVPLGAEPRSGGFLLAHWEPAASLESNQAQPQVEHLLSRRQGIRNSTCSVLRTQ